MKYMISEEELFLKGIKPAILFQSKSEKCKDSLLLKYKEPEYITVVTSESKNNRSSILIVRDKKQLEEKRLGVILGYFPKSVDAFIASRNEDTKNKRITTLINFGGLEFNTVGYFDEALKWCNNAYGEKMKKEYGGIEVRKTNLYVNEENKVESVKTEKVRMSIWGGIQDTL